MSGTNNKDVKEQELADDALINKVDGDAGATCTEGTKMSGTNNKDVKEQELADDALKNKVDIDNPEANLNALDKHDDSPMPSPLQEEEIIKKKYGGIIPKKPPLISKDHERAYFDSADWALGKQGAQKLKGPLEAFRPKLQPTPHQQVRSRRSAYAPSDDGEDDTEISSEDQSRSVDGDDNNNNDNNNNTALAN